MITFKGHFIRRLNRNRGEKKMIREKQEKSDKEQRKQNQDTKGGVER
jgi:hypothetical protein